MKPASFRYLAPRSEDELLSVLDEHGADARLLAGGQSLVPMMNFRVVSPAVIVDINHIKTLSFIKHASSSIDVGALTRHAMLEDSRPGAGGVAHRRREPWAIWRIVPCAIAAP